MEGLKKRTYFFAAVMLIAGGVNMITVARAERPDRDEKWMEARAPVKVNDMDFFRSAQNPEQSYKMDKTTYSILAPYGIVARVFRGDDGRSFDAVLIASESRASFHDPRICFSGSGWNLLDQKTEIVQTRTRGVVPVTITSMSNERNQGQLAAFFYKGPSGFHSLPRNLKWDMFFQKLLNKPNVEGVFYRFIPQYPNATEEEVKAFIVEFLEAAKDSSDGYF